MKKTYLSGTFLSMVLLLSGCGDPEPIYETITKPWNKEATLEFTSSTYQEVGKGEETAEFTFNSSQEHFNVASDRSWCTARVEDNCRLIVSVEANTYANNRLATITIVAGYEDNVTAPQTVQVLQKPGDTQLPAIGTILDNGIVFWNSSNAETAGYKIVSLKRMYGKPWSTVQEETGADSKSDAWYNIEQVKLLGHMEDYPAINFCDTLDNGAGWYLPAENEFPDIMMLYNGGTLPTNTKPSLLTQAERDARASFEALIAQNGGDPFNSMGESENGDSYWLSNEQSATNGRYVRVGAYLINNGAKTSTARGARCVRYYNLQ